MGQQLTGAMLLVAVTVSAQTDEAAVPVTAEVGPSTRPPLTGIPQIDYIWDPNLPRELNGYNLSTYPFLDRVPKREEMDFKCDGLHDGFYASVPLKCQVMHSSIITFILICTCFLKKKWQLFYRCTIIACRERGTIFCAPISRHLIKRFSTANSQTKSIAIIRPSSTTGVN